MFLDSIFEKKVTIYKKKDSETWKQIKTALKNAGLTGVSAGHYQQDAVMAVGCGAKLDPRDFGAKGKVDHDIYFVKVREADEEKAREILLKEGIAAEVCTNLMEDASVRAERLREQ